MGIIQLGNNPYFIYVYMRKYLVTFLWEIIQIKFILITYTQVDIKENGNFVNS